MLDGTVNYSPHPLTAMSMKVITDKRNAGRSHRDMTYRVTSERYAVAN